MTEKIKQLEQALEETQNSSDPAKLHPLLGESSRPVSEDPPDVHTLFDDDGQVREMTDVMGSLSIGQFGQAKYHGESASSEVIIVTSPCNTNLRFSDGSTFSSCLRLVILDWDRANMTWANISQPADISRSLTDLKNLGLPPEIIELCNAYPFGFRENPYTKYPFTPYIPAQERALHLTDLYYENMAWM